MDLWMESYDEAALLIGHVPAEARSALCVAAVEQCLGFFAVSFPLCQSGVSRLVFPG
jgi:hypothetical protein